MPEYHCLLFEPVLLWCINVLTTIKWTETVTHACADHAGMLFYSTGDSSFLVSRTCVSMSESMWNFRFSPH